MSRYDDLGIRPVINAAATLTRLGGSVLPPPVVAAMAEAAETHVDLPLLQERVGERIAALTHNDACYVSSGAAAGIAIAVAACIAGEDPAAIARFPYLQGGKSEVIIHRAHRNGYDHAARQTGATLVEIGMAHSTQPWELEAAISPRTACVLWFAGAHYATGALPLPQVEEATLANYEATVQRWIAGLRDLPGVTVERGYPSEAGQPHARAILRIGPEAAMTRDALAAALYNGSPCVAVGTVGTDAIA